MSPSLELRGVARDYGKGVRIGPISFAVEPGSFVSLLGPSGCGKTTILRCIAGFEHVDDGALLIEGAEVSAVPAHRRGVGLVFQSYALFPHLTVAENVAFGLRLRRASRADREMKVASTLQIVGLESLASRLPSQISGGQQQRVAIARSLVLEPSIMLLDEPLSNLDYKLRLQMRRELLALQRRLGMTFVFVTHDQSEALALSDQIIVLSSGRIEQIGTPAEVYAKPLSYFVADFIGGSNLLKVTAAEPLSDNRARVKLEAGGTFTAAYATGTSPREAAWLSLRAEDLTLAAPADAGAPDTLSGRPISRLFAGDRVEITLQLDPEDGGLPILVSFYSRPEEAIGERVTVRAAPGTPVLVAGGP